MRRSDLALALLLALAAAPALADQQAWVARADAERAAQLLPAGSTARAFCAPCGDTTWQPLPVETVAVAPTGTGDWWEVLVNGQGVDLAYTYVANHGRHENLALLLGLEAFDVPRLLPEPDAAPPSPAAELRAAEAELEAEEGRLAAALGRDREKSLRRAQDAWRRFRDAEAELEAGLAGGAAAVEVRLRLTRERLGVLQMLQH